jgi:hypothetical protein
MKIVMINMMHQFHLNVKLELELFHFSNFSSCKKSWMIKASFQTQAEVALAAADGDPSVAIEILMSQQVNDNLISIVIVIL